MSKPAKNDRSKLSAHGRAALEYRRRGWSVVPVEDRGKRPLVAWERFQHGLPEAADIRHWFRRWPDANLSVVTGTVSKIVVLDVDTRHDGESTLRDLEARYWPLPETVTAVTGGGGRHYYFAHPGSELRNRVGLAKGIDLRGDGGTIVVPPSIHASGRSYVWADGLSPDELTPAPMPTWLLSLARGEKAGAGHPLPYWRSLVGRGVDEGERNNTVASLAGHLLWHKVDPVVVKELMLSWNRTRCRPPLPDDEVRRTIDSIVQTHKRERAGAQTNRIEHEGRR